MFERTEWGHAYGWIDGLDHNSERFSEPDELRRQLELELNRLAELTRQIDMIERREMNPLNYELNQLRLAHGA